MSDLIELAAMDRLTFSLYSPAYQSYLFVSNDKKGQDNIVETHQSVESRNTFVLEAAGNSLYRIRNIAYNRYLFISNDTYGGDKVVEAHPYRGEQRNLFRFEEESDGTFLIFNEATGLYLFVSNDKKGGDCIVEGHSSEFKNEYRNKFALMVNYNYKRWMEKNSHLYEKKLAEICLPASHDSGAYALRNKIVEKDSTYAAIEAVCQGDVLDKIPAPNLLPIENLGAWVKTEILYPTIIDLAQATNFSIADQLADGIRCLDLRVCYESESNEFYLYHGVIGPKLLDVLSDINDFLNSTSGELVYVTLGHWENFPTDQSNLWSKLSDQVVEMFAGKIYKPEYHDKKICNNPFYATLSSILSSNGKTLQSTVILVAGGDNFLDTSIFFPSSFSPPDNDSAEKVIHGCYTNTSDRKTMLEGQANNWKSNYNKLPFALYLTLTPDEDSIKSIAIYNAGSALQAATSWLFWTHIKEFYAVLKLMYELLSGGKPSWMTLRELSKIANQQMGLTIQNYFQSLDASDNKISFLYIDYYHDTLSVDIAIALSGGDSTPAPSVCPLLLPDSY